MRKETATQRKRRLEKRRQKDRARRAAEDEETKRNKLEMRRLRRRTETYEKRESRLKAQRQYMAKKRATEEIETLNKRLVTMKQHSTQLRTTETLFERVLRVDDYHPTYLRRIAGETQEEYELRLECLKYQRFIKNVDQTTFDKNINAFCDKVSEICTKSCCPNQNHIFQSEEEILRNKKNTLIKTTNDLVAHQSPESRSKTESPDTEERLLSNLLQSTNMINNTVDSIKKEIDSFGSDNSQSNFSTSLQKERAKVIPATVDSEKDVIPLENDEVFVLPLPESRIPVIDLDHIGAPNYSNGTDVFSKKSSNTESISANCHKFRNLVAHNAAVNSLQVFDDYLYTCANDKTAKRINIKDPTKIITFSHAEKNIIHLCVERMGGKAYVFTSASKSNFITVFDAESALKVKVHQFQTNIANMCKGKRKIYVGLRTGQISTCDWKEQKELVHNEESIRSIATAHQGGINILVVLSSKGNVSVRDADKNGLLIKYVKAIPHHVPFFMSVYNDWVYISSAGYLSVLDLSVYS